MAHSRRLLKTPLLAHTPNSNGYFIPPLLMKIILISGHKNECDRVSHSFSIINAMKTKGKPGMVAHAQNPSAGEAGKLLQADG